MDKSKSTLKEDNTYIVQNFEVELDNGEYKVSKHPYRLLFMKGMIMQERELPQIPYYVYQFTSFEDIMSGHASPNVLVGNS